VGLAQSERGTPVVTLALVMLGLTCSGTPQADAKSLNSAPKPAQRSLSQVKPTPPLPRSMSRPAVGRSVTINGRTVVGTWLQWPDSKPDSKPKLGLSDLAWVNGVGGEFLDTELATVQPVQWFSAGPKVPNALHTLLFQGVRYLDLSEMAQTYRWQVQTSGGGLTIQTPEAKLTGIRQGKQPWGDRLVLDLDAPTPHTLVRNASELLLTVDAQVDANLARSLEAALKPGTYVKSLKIETKGRQLQLRFGLTGLKTRSQLTTLAQPNRLVLDIRPDGFVPHNIHWSPGVRWRQQWVTVRPASGGANPAPRQFPVIWVELDPATPGLALQPIFANPRSAMGTAPMGQITSQAGAIAGINAGFFNRNNQLPLGAVRYQNRWLSGPILGRGAIAWTPNTPNQPSRFQVGRLALQERVLRLNQPSLALTQLNSGFVQAGVARYSPDWGVSYTSLTDKEVVFSLNLASDNLASDNTGSILASQTLASQGTTIPMPKGGLLVVRGGVNSGLNVGDRITLQTEVLPSELARFPNLVAAGPLMVQGGQIVLDGALERFSPAFLTETASRSGIAQTAQGKILLVAVHDSLGGGGASLGDMAQILQQLGAVDGLNLDGGSSTALYLGDQILDRPSRTAARVNNAIGVFYRP
jgi:Phosphodiester glycosidase